MFYACFEDLILHFFSLQIRDLGSWFLLATQIRFSISSIVMEWF